jgi:crossover junction endodeoxyribonuclease RuvC
MNLMGKTTLYLGADPGLSGGLAVVAVADGVAPALVECIDIPVTGTGAKERVDVAAIRDFIDRHKPTYALIERAGAMPGQGSSSGFKYGRAVGAIEAAIALCSVPMEIVEPSIWKKFYKLPGKDKEAARQKAIQLFPDAHAMLARRKDHGRSEASLIALYGIERERQYGPATQLHSPSGSSPPGSSRELALDPT